MTQDSYQVKLNVVATATIYGAKDIKEARKILRGTEFLTSAVVNAIDEVETVRISET